MDDFTSILAQLPPGEDVYDFLGKTVDDLLYPDLGRSFYVQAYVAVALCGLVTLGIAAGLFIRWRKKRLYFLVSDGSATRPNPKTVVPVLWLITGILISHHLTFSLGVFWWMMACALVCSYAVISTSVICAAPAVRKGLMRLNEGHAGERTAPAFLAVNGSLFLVCILAVCSTYPAGRLAGQGFAALDEAYTGVQALIEKARAEQNLAVMASFTDYVELLNQAQYYDHRSIYVGGAIYSTHVVVFFLTGLIPAIFLNLYLRKRIDRLDKGLSASSQHQSTTFQQSMNAVPLPFGHQYGDQDVEILAGGLQYRVSLKAKPLKDTPFSNLTPTSMLPTNYASIFRAKVDPQEKANRLKIALRRDNIQLMAYFLMLASLGSLAFFQAAKGPYDFSTKLEFIAAHAWQMWSYLLPAIVLAGAFLYDAASSVNGEKEVADMQASSFAARSFVAPPLSTIQLSQTVEVVEEHALQEKKSMAGYEKMSRDHP